MYFTLKPCMFHITLDPDYASSNKSSDVTLLADMAHELTWSDKKVRGVQQSLTILFHVLSAFQPADRIAANCSLARRFFSILSEWMQCGGAPYLHVVHRAPSPLSYHGRKDEEV